jgi:hypothetical protein
LKDGETEKRLIGLHSVDKIKEWVNSWE